MPACEGFGAQGGGGKVLGINEGGVGMEFSGAIKALIGPCCLSKRLFPVLKRLSSLFLSFPFRLLSMSGGGPSPSSAIKDMYS